jgi:TolB-like protein/DNA-binding winged helix-turn-helix (wHTH) protein/Tfp pilus assembly protein PilF
VDALVTIDVFLFEGFRLDRSGLSRCDDQGGFVPVPLGSRALEVLGVLVARSGDLVARDEIMSVVWPGVVVESSNLPVQIAALRRVLDEGRPNGSCIQTVPGRGYRFVAPVTSAETVTAASFSRSANGASGPVAADEEPELLSAVCPIDGLSPVPKLGTPPRRRRAVIALIAAGAVCLTFAVVAAMNWRSLSPWANGSPPRLSIVVLPFANLSNDTDQQYFADGITDDLTTDLSRIPDMFVISRNTAFTYRNKPVDTKQLGRGLGVRYVLEGSVRRSGNNIRVNAQLIDAQTDTHLWAEQVDGDMSDLFALQKEITGRIANTLSLELVTAETARPTDNPDALDYILRGRAARAKPNSPEVLGQAINLFERALAVDPQSVEAQTELAWALASRVLDGMTTSAVADLARAEQLVNQALSASPRYAYAHVVKADIMRARHLYERAIPEYETALALNPNLSYPLHALGECKLMTGLIEDVISIEEQSIRLNPLDGQIAGRYWRIGMVHLLESRTDEAIPWFEKARAANPSLLVVHAALASAYGLKGETERAAAELAEARRLAGEGSFSSIAKMRAGAFWAASSPKIRELLEATYFAGFRKAGVPEE